MQGLYTLLTHIMSCRDKIHRSWVSLWFKFLPWFFEWFFFQPSMCWFWLQLIIVTSYVTSEIIFNLDIFFFKIWCVIQVFHTFFYAVCVKNSIRTSPVTSQPTTFKAWKLSYHTQRFSVFSLDEFYKWGPRSSTLTEVGDLVLSWHGQCKGEGDRRGKVTFLMPPCWRSTALQSLSMLDCTVWKPPIHCTVTAIQSCLGHYHKSVAWMSSCQFNTKKTYHMDSTYSREIHT